MPKAWLFEPLQLLLLLFCEFTLATWASCPQLQEIEIRADHDLDREGHGDRLHQRHINPRMHVSRWVCGRMSVNVGECGVKEFE